MENLNVQAAWISILIGLTFGAGLGLFFHEDTWLGGYFSWQRRMLRLGHISFFGTAFLNLSFAVTLSVLSIDYPYQIASYSLVAGSIAMPLVCVLSALHKPFRHLFFIPVLCLIAGAGDLLWRGLLQ